METLIATKNLLSDTQHTCFVIPALFSKAECEELLTTEIKGSFQQAISNYPSYYRNNERFVFDSEYLATRLFKKVKPYLPHTIEVNANVPSENGTWNLKELNNRLRFCRYSANQYFHRHLDGVHYRNETTQSKLTFMIYLNSATNFEGGRTLFFKTKETEEIWAAYTPAEGDLIVFDHNVWHEGEMLTKGEKFVLRSDIIYTRAVTENSERPFAGHLGYIWSLLKFNDNTILSGGRDKEIKRWTSTGDLQQTLKGHQNSILSMARIDNDTFISCSRDRQIIVWRNFEIVSRIQIHSAIVLSLCSLDNNIFASGSGDNTIKISNLNGTVLRTFAEHKNWVWQIIKLNDGFIASCSEDASIKIWDVTKANALTTIYETAPVTSLAFNLRTRLLVSGNLNGEISLRKLSTCFELQDIKSYKAHSGIIRTIKFIGDDRIATGGEDNKVKIWRLDGQLISEFEHENFVQSIELLNDNTIISASYDGTIKAWPIDDVEGRQISGERILA